MQQMRLREPFNGLSHAIGALLAAATLWYLVRSAAALNKPVHVVAFAIYGTSLLLLYTSSALYHLLPVSERAIAMLRRVDHIMIYVLIAGTYTPICWIVLPASWGKVMLALIWLFAAAGILFTVLWLNAPRWIGTSVYVLMGWSALIAIVPLVQSLSTEGLAWLAAGGAFYTGGAIVYGMKKPNPFPGTLGFHEIWHLMVIAGSFCHFMMMASSVLPFPNPSVVQ